MQYIERTRWLEMLTEATAEQLAGSPSGSRALAESTGVGPFAVTPG